MLALVHITAWHWIAFVACVLVFLALDLGVFHRRAHEVKFKEALIWTGVWISLALSMDNVFVIALIFTYFKIPSQFQHRVLFWGILGALLMRGAMIGAGVAL